jgi:hypothetical protein
MDNNLKFDVKKYRIVESKELIKEAIDPISIIVALVSFLLGALAGAAASFGRVYGSENGAKMAEGVEKIKKTMEEAIDASDLEDKDAKKTEFKAIVKKYEDAIVDAAGKADPERETAVTGAFATFKQETQKFVEDNKLQVNTEEIFKDIEITSAEVQDKEAADKEFKEEIMTNLSQPAAYQGIVKRILEMYSKDSKDQRMKILFFKKVIPTLKRTKKIFDFFNKVNEVVSTKATPNEILAGLVAIPEMKTLAKLDSGGIQRAFGVLIRGLAPLDQRTKIAASIQADLTGDTTAIKSATTGSGGNYALDPATEGSAVITVGNVFLRISGGRYTPEITDDIANYYEEVARKVEQVLDASADYDAASASLGRPAGSAAGTNPYLVSLRTNIGNFVAAKQKVNTDGSEDLKIVFNKNIPDIESGDIRIRYAETKDRFSQTIHAISDVVKGLSTLNSGSINTVTKKTAASPSPSSPPPVVPEGLTYGAVLDDGTLVCEGCLFQYMNEHKNLITEAKYQGRSVPLGKPMRGDVKKFKVFVKDPSTGNIKKVNFGDPNMKIKKNIPARRKSFRARHKCDTAKDRTSARYWSCRMWENKQLDDSINNRMRELSGLIED